MSDIGTATALSEMFNASYTMLHWLQCAQDMCSGELYFLADFAIGACAQKPTSVIWCTRALVILMTHAQGTFRY